MERREFLRLSLTAAGGLGIAFHLPLARQPAAAAAAPFAPNAWLRIDPDNRITFVCPSNEMGQDVHTALATLVAEELEVPVASLVIEQAPAAAVYTNAMLGGQLTGGSTSVRDAWLKLRQAGAATRGLLLEAAGRTWKLDSKLLAASGGHVTGPGGKRLSYGALAATAASLPAPDLDKVALKSPSDFTQIGSPTQKRLDTPAKLRGDRLFGIDATQPGMVYAALAQSPVIGGTVQAVDDRKARAIPGVRAVVNIGDGVAVVADHFWTAKKARDALQVKWLVGAAGAVSNDSVARALELGTGKAAAIARESGDVASGLNQASRKLEARYELPMLAHVALEPMNCLALVANGTCDIWTSTQYPEGARAAAAARGGVKPESVRIHPQFIGGGFGRRLETDAIGQAAAIAKAVPGVPVKLIWTREDDTTHDYYRPASLHTLEGGLDKYGNLVALHHRMVSPSVTARAFPAFVKDGLDPFMTEGAANLTYAIPHFRTSTVIQDTGVRVGYWRSVSHALNAFAFESFMDELASAAGKDPVAFRLALLGSQPRQRAVLDKVAAMAGWGGPAGRDRALGVASMECYGTHVATVAEVRRQGDKLRCERIWVAVDPGIAVRPDQVQAQIVSGVITGLTGALKNRITIRDGQVQETNFHQFEPLRLAQAPRIDVAIVASGAGPGGMGEVGTPLVAPALANAVARLTGKRVRSLPFSAAGVNFG
ncbi:MAG: xanthine dehydrogenase family protein molybdopterin-binding subunit [Chromatiales bacterium]|nr:xanthine dehydrogenase family protein molybdopterin-binding subunit [Chromatiales bacterium]